MKWRNQCESCCIIISCPSEAWTVIHFYCRHSEVRGPVQGWSFVLWFEASKPIHGAEMHSLRTTIIAPVSVYHRVSYAERYNRYKRWYPDIEVGELAEAA